MARGAERIAAMLHRAADEQIPVSGSVAMTHRCQLHCLHCYLGDERFQKPDGIEQPTAFWSSLLDQMAEAGCLNLLITGGEPLVRKDFGELYHRAKHLGMLVTVFTNATLLDAEVAALFADLPPELVEVSLYGASERVYEGVTGIPGSYRRCLDGVEALVSRGVRTGLKTVILRENAHEVEAMRAMAREQGIPFRVDPAVFPCMDGTQDPIAHRLDAESAVELEMADTELLAEAAVAFGRTGEAPPTDSLYSCMAGLTGFHVDPRGVLYPCMMVTTGGYDLTLGSFATGWRDAMPPFRAQVAPPGYECHECEMRVLCGACPAQSALETGSLHEKADFMCELGAARMRRIREAGAKAPQS